MANRDTLYNDLQTSLQIALDGKQSEIWTALPAIVKAVNFDQMTVDCQPAIQGIVSDDLGYDSYVNLPLLINCPIVFPSAGGFLLTLPIAVNDEVLVVFSSRAIDSHWQSGGLQPPIEQRMHDMSDGYVLLGPRSLPKVVSNISSTNAQLRNDSGDTYLEITPSGQVNVKGNLSITGNITTTGSITATGDVKGMGISLATHTHSAGNLSDPSGPVTGTTGVPVP